MRLQMPSVEGTVTARGRLMVKVVMDDGLSGGNEHESAVICTEQGRAMVAVFAPKFAAGIAGHVFDGLLLKAYPSQRVRDIVAESSSHPGCRWQRELWSGSLDS